jgi:hypothetical protein
VRATGTVLDNTMAVMAVTMVVTYQVWDQFRHDKGSPPQPAATQPAVAPVPE